MSESAPIKDIYFSTVNANGLTHRIASPTDLSSSSSSKPSPQNQPLIIFLHGFPESWYSWRHQLLFFKDQPYFAIAPDMRGYGSTDQPDPVEEYAQTVLAKDVVEIAKCLGYSKFIAVGHDWGAALAWNVSILYPDNVAAVCGMSVPFVGHPEKGGLTALQEKFGKCLEGSSREQKAAAKFHYILYHNLPKVEQEYDANAEEALFRLYTFDPVARMEEGTPEVTDELMFPSSGDETKDRERELDATAAPGLWKRIPKAKSLPSWLSKDDLDYYVSQFKTAGFKGGLRWYQALDLNWELMKHTENKKIEQPSLFVMGERDGVMDMFGGKEALLKGLKGNTEKLKDAVFYDGGHWIQQEQPDRVNHKLLEFVDNIPKDDLLSKM